MNSIAARNLQRLSKLIQEGAPAPATSAVDPRLFIEESGKTAVTSLVDVTSFDQIATLTAPWTATQDAVTTYTYDINGDLVQVTLRNPRRTVDVPGPMRVEQLVPAHGPREGAEVGPRVEVGNDDDPLDPGSAVS